MRLLLLSFVFLSQAHAWEIKKVGKDMLLTDSSLKTPEKVITAFESKDLPVEKISTVTIVRYPENIAGTTSLSKTHNCAAVFNGKIILKDEICLVEGEDSRKAEFKVVNNKLQYKFEEVEEEFVLE